MASAISMDKLRSKWLWQQTQRRNLLFDISRQSGAKLGAGQSHPRRDR
jgi:hypothetical protein